MIYFNQRKPLNSGRTLVNGHNIYIGDSSNQPVQLVNFQDTNNAKSLIASAIVSKNGSANATMTFSQLATAIRNIQTTTTVVTTQKVTSVRIDKGTGMGSYGATGEYYTKSGVKTEWIFGSGSGQYFQTSDIDLSKGITHDGEKNFTCKISGSTLIITLWRDP